MATENIVSKVYRVLTDVSSRVWDKISFWCLAKDVELANGKNLETTCGSITGITSSLTSTSTTMAASASAIKQLNDKIADLNSNLVNFKSYKTICLWDSTNSTVERTITAKAKGTVFVFMSNRADGNLTNNVNINQQFTIKQNGNAVSPYLIDDNMTQFNDGAGTRMAMAVLNVNAGDAIYLCSNVWAAFNYINRGYISVPSDFTYA